MAVKMAAEGAVMLVVNKIRWMAAQMADCLAERMVLTKNVSAFGWMGMKEAARGDGYMAVTWVQ